MNLLVCPLYLCSLVAFVALFYYYAVQASKQLSSVTNGHVFLFPRHRSHVVVIDMLVEGRINQPPSTRSVDSSGAASVWRPDPVPAPFLSERSRPSAQQRLSPQSSRSWCSQSHWRKRLPLSRVRHWHRALICTILTLYTLLATISLPALFRQLSSRLLRPSSPGHWSPATVRRHIPRVAFLLIALTVVMSCASFGVHCSTTSNSHSASHTSQHSFTHLSHNPELRQLFERQFLSKMGLISKPSPPAHHKVSEHMLDLYHWFRRSNRERPLLEDASEDTLYSKSPNAVMGLVSEDLRNLGRPGDPYDAEEEAEEESRLIERINGHHRAPTQRRPSQVSRVTLNGPTSTIISHKMKDHDGKPF